MTRFSGRRAPLHPGGVPHLPDAVTREAYSHEVSSAGFWAGDGGWAEPAFYSYAYPAPAGFAPAPRSAPAAARFDAALGEFLLPYEAVRSRVPIPTRRCSPSCKRPTTPPPISPTGTAPRWSAERASPAAHGR